MNNQDQNFQEELSIVLSDEDVKVLNKKHRNSKKSSDLFNPKHFTFWDKEKGNKLKPGDRIVILKKEGGFNLQNDNEKLIELIEAQDFSKLRKDSFFNLEFNQCFQQWALEKIKSGKNFSIDAPWKVREMDVVGAQEVYPGIMLTHKKPNYSAVKKNSSDWLEKVDTVFKPKWASLSTSSYVAFLKKAA